MSSNIINWLLNSDEPWTCYRVLVDLQKQQKSSKQVKAIRKDMLNHPKIIELIKDILQWGSKPFKRHNDASYTIYKLSTLADFGIKASDPGMKDALKVIMKNRSKEGAYQTLVNIPKTFGGTGKDIWTWILCDTPTLLYSFLAM